jgi:hypothetical protein
LLRLLHQNNFRAEFFESAAVRIEIALEGEHSNSHGRRRSIISGRWSFVVGQKTM